jgi:hypothetical protein
MVLVRHQNQIDESNETESQSQAEGAGSNTGQ